MSKIKISEELNKVVEMVRHGDTREKIAKSLNIKIWKARQLIAVAQTIINGLPRVGIDPRDPLFRSEIIRKLRSSACNPEDLADLLKCEVSDILNCIEDLEEHGYIIEKTGALVKIGQFAKIGDQSIKLNNQLYNKPLRFGVITDMHMCNKNFRQDVLDAAYDIFEEKEINTVFCAGNYVDGECNFNRYELVAHGISDQCQFAIDHWPRKNGIVTYYVDGDDHEGWWCKKEGLEFGRFLQLEAEAQGRQDLQYIGYLESDVELQAPNGSAIIKIIHPGGGSAYALSYTSQKFVESMQGGNKASVVLCGHMHKFDYCYPRNVHIVQCGCICDQTIFMRKKKLEAHVGFLVCTLQQDINGGVSRFVPEFFPFYDRGYYIKRDGIGDRLKNSGL